MDKVIKKIEETALFYREWNKELEASLERLDRQHEEIKKAGEDLEVIRKKIEAIKDGLAR